MSHWSGSRCLASVTPSILYPFGTPPSYAVVALCQRDPIAFDQQDQPFQVLQQFTDEVDEAQVTRNKDGGHRPLTHGIS